MNPLAGADHFCHVVRFGGHLVIHADFAAVQGEMFLDEACAEGSGGHWNFHANAVVGVTYRMCGKFTAKAKDILQADGFGFDRVNGDAMENDDLIVAGIFYGFNCSNDFGNRSHSCGKDQWDSQAAEVR